MRDVTVDNLSQAVLSLVHKDTDPRLEEIFTSLVGHLHTFVRESNITHAEWSTAIQFLHQVGELSDKERSEFTLLSDVLGVSSLVDMLNSDPRATSGSALGPFHIAGSPTRNFGADLRGDFDAPVVLLEGRVLGTDGQPIAGATIDMWQNAPNGLYSSQDPNQERYSFHGIFSSDENGRYAFTTTAPIPYKVPTDGPVGDLLEATGRDAWRPAHFHFIVAAEGYTTLVTEAFLEEDPCLDRDAVFAVRDDLIVGVTLESSEQFPEGYELSGKVQGSYSKVVFDIVMNTEK